MTHQSMVAAPALAPLLPAVAEPPAAPTQTAKPPADLDERILKGL